MKIRKILIIAIVFAGIVSIFPISHAFEFSWQIDETPEGQESATAVEPIEVTLLEQPMQVSSHSAAIFLMKKYSVYIDTNWIGLDAYKLLQTFESIPQRTNWRFASQDVQPSVWQISNSHIHNDIDIEHRGDTRVVTITSDAFTYANPLLAEIEGVRGRFFSKRLHNAVVRFVTDDGNNKDAIRKILRERYDVSIDIPDYAELTKHTTGENHHRFSEFKSEELLVVLSMLEEFPQGMLTTPGLKYLVRRLDGTPHPIYPTAPAVAWTSAGYIEFMESAFKGAGYDYMHRLILHEKAHFLWEYLFDEQLKQDWVELGGWYENPDDQDGWSTTKQVEFVSAYAHGVNPNEDMAESISFYIVRPDKLRSRAPAKYEFIKNRIMHGTRYISQIREDLTFEVYNLYPDYVYPGRIIRIDIQVEGEPEEDKLVKIEIELHKESKLDAATVAGIRIFSPKGSYTGLRLYPVDEQGNRIPAGHILRGHVEVSRYAPNGYWQPDQIKLTDANRNDRLEAQTDFNWKMYIDNPLADCESPKYVPNSMRLSLSQPQNTDEGEYQIITARWQATDKTGINLLAARVNDTFADTYSRFSYGSYDSETNTAEVNFTFPNYMPGGIYSLNYITMRDIALNYSGYYFTDPEMDEEPQTIEIHTTNPDFNPPELDLNNITIEAEPTNPEEPNGETIVNITFFAKDNISGYTKSSMRLRDPNGVTYLFRHYPEGRSALYFPGDPTIWKEYNKTIILPVGSIPGIWGLAQMELEDKAGNTFKADFTEIVRFEVGDVEMSTSDVNGDGITNILDLVIVAQAFDEYNANADVNSDGVVSILDLVLVASVLGNDDMAAPSLHKNDLQNWLTLALQNDNRSYRYREGLNVLRQLLHAAQPETTALLSNYPNPFNPETWIPYQLAEPATVTLHIYTVSGALVRMLDLGHQPAGIYHQRSRAAYWDGQNQLGEPVASGLYWYTLTADNFTATRRMLIRK